jgi:FtsH-binding integral membrane protein
VSLATSYYTPESVLLSIAVMVVTTVCLWAASLFITSMRFYWQGLLLSLVVACLMNVVGLTLLLAGAWQSAQVAYGLGGAFVYGLYVIIDIKLISEKIEIDDYILGALTLYLDLINLFIQILKILGKAKKD